MIKAIDNVFNNFGKARLIKFYDYYPVERQNSRPLESDQLVSRVRDSRSVPQHLGR